MKERDDRIATLKSALASATKELHDLEGDRDADLSRQFIAVNGITAEDVESSGGEGKPWFGDVVTFANWMKSTGSQKRWAEWNGSIHFASDLRSGRWSNTPALARDVLGWKEGGGR